MTESKQKRERQPATEAMKAVAREVFKPKMAQDTFTQEELEEMMVRRADGEKLSHEENRALKEKYRKMKRWVLEREKTNNQKLYFVPSIIDNEEFYKGFNTTALYYAYRLADRFERSSRVMADKDHYSKATHVVSATNMPKLVDQVKDAINAEVEVTEDGIYIFTLPKPLTDDEIGQLRHIEQERRERMHEIVKPKKMDPATFNAILMVIRQVAPKVTKLDKQNYYMYGEDMLKQLSGMLKTYADFAEGLTKPEDAALILRRLLNSITAELTILTETGVWDFAMAAPVAENIAEIRRLVMKDFKIK